MAMHSFPAVAHNARAITQQTAYKNMKCKTYR